MTRIIIVAFTITVSCAVSVSAQPINCGDCKKAATDAASIRAQIDARNAELQRLQQEQRVNDANLKNVRQLRGDAVVKRGGSDQASVKEYEQSIDDLQADNKGNREQQFKTQEELRSLNEQLEKIGRDVDDCTKRCGSADPSLPTGTNVYTGPEIGTGGEPGAGGVGAPPLRTSPPCDDCPQDVTELENEHKELQRRAERANATGESEHLRDFEQQRRRVRELQRQADDCNKECKPKTTAQLLRGPLPYIALAGGGGVLLATRGGDGTPTQASSTSTTTTAPDSFNGRWMVNGTVNENGCMLPPSAQATVDVAVNSSGNGTITMQSMFGAPGQPPEQYVFPNVTLRMNGNQGSVEAETASSQFLRVIIQFTFVNPLTGRMSLFRGNCHTGLNVNGTRQ